MKPSSLICAVESVLRQGCALLTSINNETYTLKGKGPDGASIGAHYRHVLDHFLCLIQGLWDGEINYDRRARSPELEGSVEAALDATEELIQTFHTMTPPVLHKECTIIYSVGYDEPGAQAVRSVIAREVMFCVGHAIHHYAILKLLCAERAVALPYEFGIAPSTLKHLEAQAAQ
jgi:hypothetical protein